MSCFLLAVATRVRCSPEVWVLRGGEGLNTSTPPWTSLLNRKRYLLRRVVSLIKKGGSGGQTLERSYASLFAGNWLALPSSALATEGHKVKQACVHTNIRELSYSLCVLLKHKTSSSRARQLAYVMHRSQMLVGLIYISDGSSPTLSSSALVSKYFNI